MKEQRGQADPFECSLLRVTPWADCFGNQGDSTFLAFRFPFMGLIESQSGVGKCSSKVIIET